MPLFLRRGKRRKSPSPIPNAWPARRREEDFFSPRTDGRGRVKEGGTSSLPLPMPGLCKKGRKRKGYVLLLQGQGRPKKEKEKKRSYTLPLLHCRVKSASGERLIEITTTTYYYEKRR